MYEDAPIPFQRHSLADLRGANRQVICWLTLALLAYVSMASMMFFPDAWNERLAPFASTPNGLTASAVVILCMHIAVIGYALHGFDNAFKHLARQSELQTGHTG